MRVLVSGGSGFIGGHLVRALVKRGDLVTVLTRHPKRAAHSLPPEARAVAWDPLERGDWFRSVEDQDAVVHVAGQQAVGVRYTPETRRALFDSRVKSGELLSEAILAAQHRPTVYLSGSAVGFYGSDFSADRKTEAAGAGSDFLATLCKAWEATLERPRDAGVRTLAARVGIVLAADGGALPKMALPFRLGMGGPIGTGRQGLSWIHHQDLVRALLFLLDHRDAEGPVNVCAPHPVTNAEFSRALGHALRRPCWLPAPSFAVRLAFGNEGAQPILGGQRAVPARLIELGFRWSFPELEAALSDAFAPVTGAS